MRVPERQGTKPRGGAGGAALPTVPAPLGKAPGLGDEHGRPAARGHPQGLLGRRAEERRAGGAAGGLRQPPRTTACF